MLSRRGFVLSGLAVGGGLVIGYTQWRFNDGDAAAKFAASGNEAAPLNAWLKIDNSGQITCAIHRAEMGQGVTTSLAMLLAEELDADWSQMRFEFAPVDRDYYNFGMLLNGQPLGDPEASWLAGTGTWAMRKVFHSMGLSMTISSSSMIDAWDTLRPAGASARQMLIAAAAGQWQVPAESLRTESGWVIDDAQDRKASYGELAEAAARERPPSKPRLKDSSQYRIIGHDVPRLDTAIKVQGAAKFGVDVVQPDMLYAAIVHSPIAGTDIGSFETNGAEELPGIERILLAGEAGKERAVAVVADSTIHAFTQQRRCRGRISCHARCAGKSGRPCHLSRRRTGRCGYQRIVGGGDGCLRSSFSRPCLHGTDELHSLFHRYRARGLGADTGSLRCP